MTRFHIQHWLIAALVTAATLPAQTAHATQTALTAERVELRAQTLLPQSSGPYTWELLEQPPGSAVQLEARSGTMTALTPQVDGGYSIRISGVRSDGSKTQATIAVTTLGDTLALRNTLDHQESMQCLAVQDPSLSGGKSWVTVKLCDRNTQAQRWSRDGQGRLHSAINYDYCMDAGASTSGTQPTVAPCDARRGAQLWALSDQPVQRGFSPPVTVQTKDQRYSLFFKGKLQLSSEASTWMSYNNDYKWATNPTNINRKVIYPLAITNINDNELERVRHLVNLLAAGSLEHQIPRDISDFPGSVPSNARSMEGDFELDRNLADSTHLRMREPPKNWLSTGLYAAAGRSVNITVDNATEQQLAGVYVRIGVHTDDLTKSGNVQEDKFLKRFNIVFQRTPLQPGVNVVRSQYGGLIILESDRSVNIRLRVKIGHAVAAPYYQQGKTTLAAWKQLRDNPAPWAELEGRRAIITVPSKDIRKLDDPGKVTDYYDRLVSLHEDLAGLAQNDVKPVHRPPGGKHRFVMDRQISVGGAHAGFPLMFNDAQYTLSAPDMVQGNDWGVWHELGHNYQQACPWADRYGIEVTVNLFSLHAEEPLRASHRDWRPNLEAHNIYADAKTLLNSNQNNKWEDAPPFVRLVFLKQMQLAFQWDVYKRLHRSYRELSKENYEAICHGTADKQIDTFFIKMSELSAHDLTEHFTKWEVPVSAQAKETVRKLGLPPATGTWKLGLPAR
ncbi:MAG TPA: M60 family metallopeptidase [Kofleriaceae bacterium]|nr:M60 family metallopeptidase [Kofleriaceae bacterium]